MSCKLHSAWLEAEEAMKQMFIAGFEAEGKYPEKYETDYRADITDIWHMYQNVRRIRENMVKMVPENYIHEHEDSSTSTEDSSTSTNDTIHITTSDNGVATLPDGCYDPDGNITLDPGVNITLGDAITSVGDAITWNNEVFNEPITFEAAPPTATQSGELPPTTIPTPRTTNPIDPEKNAEDLNNRDGD